MNFVLPPLPTMSNDAMHQREGCSGLNAWIANAGGCLLSQLVAHAHSGQGAAIIGPVLVSKTVPEGGFFCLADHVAPILGLLCRHGVIAAETEALARGIAIVRHGVDDVEISLEPAPLAGAA